MSAINVASVLVVGVLAFFVYWEVDSMGAQTTSLVVMGQPQGKALSEDEGLIELHHNSIALESTTKTTSQPDLQIVSSVGNETPLWVSGEKTTFLAEKKMSSGQTEWVSAFDVEIGPRSVVVTTKISLLPSKGVRSPILEEKIKAWQKAIDIIWNGRFYVSNGSSKIPIIFNVRLTHHKPHHRVIVRPGNWVPNQHNWHVNTPPLVVAHEIGHMFGAFDEYRGGALSPEKPMVDTTSIMGSKPETGVAYPRHLSLLDAMLAAHFKNEKVKIITVNVI